MAAVCARAQQVDCSLFDGARRDVEGLEPDGEGAGTALYERWASV